LEVSDDLVVPESTKNRKNHFNFLNRLIDSIELILIFRL